MRYYINNFRIINYIQHDDPTNNSCWFTSSESNNLGTLSSGAGTLILAFMAFLAYESGKQIFEEWKHQKRFEKKSDLADSAMNDLATFMDDFNLWILQATAVFLFNKHSKLNISRYDSASPYDKAKFDNDPWEVSNYAKRGRLHFSSMHRARSPIMCLQNKPLLEKMIEFEKIANNLTGSILQKTIPSFAHEDLRLQGLDEFNQAKNKIDKLYSSINDSLGSYILFQDIPE